jgi:DNA-binding transcriptional ArsR family regulator
MRRNSVLSIAALFHPSLVDNGKPFGYIKMRNRMVSISRHQRDAVFRALADPTRREILHLLRNGRRTVGEIADGFPVSRPAISKHLRLLRSAGLINARRNGRTCTCTINARPLRHVDEWLRDYESFWGESLRSLKSYVEKSQ